MSYQVFARKYRPQNFDSVVGQEHITTTLKNAILQERLAHAYLFVGPRGTGKTSTARIFAKALNCVNGPTVTPCGVCPQCVDIAAGTSLNVMEFDAASNTQVDKVRELIIDTVKFAPTSGKYKMYIVDEVHMLSTSSFNALLKTLEEPPRHVLFVFATTEANKVPLTIISRCQRFDMRRIPAPLIARQLLDIAANESFTLTDAAAMTIAEGAQGGMRDAESMLDQLVAFCGNSIEEQQVLDVFGFTSAETVASLCGALLAGDTPGALRVVHEQAESGKDLLNLLAGLIGHLRNLLVLQTAPESLREDLGPEVFEKCSAQAAMVPADRLLTLIEQCAETENRMKWAPNKKLHFEVAVIKSVQLLQQATLDEVLETLSAIKGGGTVAPRPARAGQQQIVVPAPRTKPAPAAVPAAAPAPIPAPTPAPAPREESLSFQDAIDAIEGKSAPKPAPKAAPVAPPEPAPVVIEKAPQPRREPEPEPVSFSETELDGIWKKFIAAVTNRRMFIAMWVQDGVLMSIERGVATLGFPPEKKFSMESLEKPEQLSLLVEAMTEAAGQHVKLAFKIAEGLVLKHIEMPAPAKTEEQTEIDLAADNPKIQAALKAFEANITSVKKPTTTTDL